ncbi:class I histocompatibility antigen, F10 alpha chain-like [Cyprinodon tularosa]|uniref:class I histocompatibility antigen, F10 alpha chain-like n=1 Tax=Cyprinodon tularosa TaxID=77115 RepID=UPI0018E26564|nr:class I histocompatibility antigen, F10 alpha chain-like [Cyprinodon tularosa]
MERETVPMEELVEKRTRAMMKSIRANGAIHCTALVAQENSHSLRLISAGKFREASRCSLREGLMSSPAHIKDSHIGNADRAWAAIHSLKYFYTASSGIPNFPSYVSVGLVDGVQISYCDSRTQKNIPKQEWMNEVSSEHPRYWEEETGTCWEKQQIFNVNIDIAKQRFNQTGGVHVYQQMYGCEWDNETGEVKGYDQIGYDGEDFIVLDLETLTWIAPVQQAVISKNEWDNDKYAADNESFYLTQTCPEWLKKYVSYGRSSLMKTDLPSVFILQKSSSSPISCFATGFYPNRAEMFWRKDGAEIHDGVEKGEILPNNDGTFQMNVDLKLLSSEDWTQYECVFQLSGVDRDINTRLEKPKIRTNEGKALFCLISLNDFLSGNSIPIIIGVVAAVLALVAIIAGIVWWKKRDNGFKPANTSDTSSASSDESNPMKMNSEEQKMMKTIS